MYIGGEGGTKPGGVGILTVEHYKDLIINLVMYVISYVIM